MAKQRNKKKRRKNKKHAVAKKTVGSTKPDSSSGTATSFGREHPVLTLLGASAMVLGIAASSVAVVDYFNPQGVQSVQPKPVLPPMKPQPPVSARLAKSGADTLAIPDKGLFYLPPVIKLRKIVETTEFLAVVKLSKYYSVNAVVQSMNILLDDIAGNSVLELGPVLQELFQSHFGVYKYSLECGNSEICSGIFSIIQVWRPTQVRHSARKDIDSDYPFYKDVGLATNADLDFGTYVRDPDVLPFVDDPFSQIIFPAKVHPSQGVRVTGMFQVENYDSPTGFLITPEFSLQNSGTNDIVRVMFGEGAPSRHIIKGGRMLEFGSNSEAESAEDERVYLSRTGDELFYFVIEYKKMGGETLVSAYLSRDPIDTDRSVPVARGVVAGWLFETGADNFRIKIWRHGKLLLGPVRFEEIRT